MIFQKYMYDNVCMNEHYVGTKQGASFSQPDVQADNQNLCNILCASFHHNTMLEE